MANLLQIVQSVAKQIPVAVPTVVTGSTDETAQALLAAATWTAKHIHRIHDWKVLTKEYTFTTLPSVAEYALPSDFDRMIADTAWNRTDYERMAGALSPQDWQLLKSGRIAIPTTVRAFRLKPVAAVLKAVLDPTPTSAQSLVYEYVSTQWCTASGGAAQADWAADTDIPIIDGRLIELGALARELRRLGMSYDEEAAEFERFLELAIANDGAMAKTVSLEPRPVGPTFAGNIPEGNWHQ
jgi:hypothetical protein